MLRELPSSMLTEWMAYDLIEPISVGWRVDQGNARLLCMLANIYRNREAHPQLFTMEDFMPVYGLIKRKSSEELYGMLRTWAVGVASPPISPLPIPNPSLKGREKEGM